MPLFLFGEYMPSRSASYVSNTAVTTIDLTDLVAFDRNDKYEIADFNVEVVGNAAAVTLTVFGPFDNSIEQTPSGDNTFPIGGKVLVLEKVALGKLRFTRTGTAAYSINITKSYEK